MLRTFLLSFATLSRANSSQLLHGFTTQGLIRLLLVWAVLSDFTACYGQSASHPNILFIMADDHGYQAISAYGSQTNKTPSIDRLAREGTRFDRCFVTNSICGPSRAVILTGKYGHLNGFIDNNRSKFN